MANAAGFLAEAHELPVLQVCRGRVILGETARHARQLVALQAAKLLEAPARHDRLEAPMVGDDVLAHQLQLRRVGPPQPAADPDPSGRDLEVEQAPFMRPSARLGNVAPTWVFSGVLSSLNRVSRTAAAATPSDRRRSSGANDRKSSARRSTTSIIGPRQCSWY